MKKRTVGSDIIEQQRNCSIWEESDMSKISSLSPYRMVLSSSVIFSVIVALSGCGSARSGASPNTYSGRGSAPQSHTQTETAVDSITTETTARKKPSVDPATANPNVRPNEFNDSTVIDSVVTDQVDSHKKVQSNVLAQHRKVYNAGPYAGSVDVSDSAAAVDDEIWRYFDLAEEYHAMGVIANREASWEEAQYYFEKCLKILAALDIESDSVLTPEAVKYNTILDNVVSDYRVALRSLGELQHDAEPSVILERFEDVGLRLRNDTLVLKGTRETTVTYDLPVVMNDRVKSSIIYFQTVAHDAFQRYLSRRYRYDRMFREVLDKYDLPQDLVYLSLVESGYNPSAYSWARAMGLWQFISSTGRLYGLKRSWWVDERKDPLKSTDAAARFLRDLYKQFGNWELAMAAYNGGPGRVRRTIKKQKTVDFWKMKLKRQTMDYVPLIYAAAIIAKDPERYGFDSKDHEPEIAWDEVTIDRCLDLKVISNKLGCSLKELKALNPELLRNYTPPNNKKYSLKLPEGSRKRFLAMYDSLPSPRETSWVRHRIKRGETVSTIASKYGVSQYAIVEANNLKRRSRIYAGKTLIVPVPLDRDYSAKSRKNKKYQADGTTYTVRSGDTLWDIARAFGTTVSSIRRINYIERRTRIYVGQKLRLPSNARKLKSNSKSPRLYASSKSNKSSSSSKKSAVRAERNTASTKTYKVRSGDTLWDIARMFGTTTGSIRRLNRLGRSSRIYPGQKLTVTGDMSATFLVHKVRRGENLSRIARKYRTTISRILANNNLIDADEIKIGDKLKIYTK